MASLIFCAGRETLQEWLKRLKVLLRLTGILQNFFGHAREQVAMFDVTPASDGHGHRTPKRPQRTSPRALRPFFFEVTLRQRPALSSARRLDDFDPAGPRTSHRLNSCGLLVTYSAQSSRIIRLTSSALKPLPFGCLFAS